MQITQEMLTAARQEMEADKTAKSGLSDQLIARMFNAMYGSAWKPIETAPKHKWVLVYGAQNLKWCVAAWNGGWETAAERGFYDIKNPTHWMEIAVDPLVGMADILDSADDNLVNWYAFDSGSMPDVKVPIDVRTGTGKTYQYCFRCINKYCLNEVRDAFGMVIGDVIYWQPTRVRLPNSKDIKTISSEL